MEFPKSWYPLCRSHELKSAQVIQVKALEQTLAVFRTEQGKPAAVKAQCCHIGADLSNGRVEGERLICTLHGWAFDKQGHCRHIPCQENIPKRLRQEALECFECYGDVHTLSGGAS